MGIIRACDAVLQIAVQSALNVYLRLDVDVSFGLPAVNISKFTSYLIPFLHRLQGVLTKNSVL